MPVNSYSVGRDLSFVLVGANGTQIPVSGVTDYTVKPNNTKLSSKPINGQRMNASLPDGWELSIKIDRKDPAIDLFFAALEAQYFAGQNIRNGTISETIQETDGSITQFQYTNVSFTYDDAGSWKSDSLIPISISAMATRRIPLS